MAERYVLQVYVGSLSRLYEALSIESSKTTNADEIVECICEKLGLSEGSTFYELAEVMGNQGGQDCKERRIGGEECPVALHLLWPKKTDKSTDFKFCLRRKQMSNLWSLSMSDSNDSQLIRDYFLRFLFQPRNSEYPDLCQLPDLTEQTLLENLKARFEKGHIYTYVGSILIAVNPFTFYPIYNPKYVQLYQNRSLGNLPPHIFAIADAAYQSMLRKRTNQCIVISGESGSGKTESTNLLLHHLTALSQKGTHGSGVEQTILGAGPVLEAFGNAKTKFNNNSSRFGKFIQVNYKENGAVHGALVQKYLLEKSRIVSQVKNERNYHVFYYLLDGLPQQDKDKLYLTKPQDYFYLNQSKCYTLEGVDERHEFLRLTQSMEMVGFSKEKQFLCFQVLSAVLHLGNVHFSKKSTYHSDETVMVKNPEVVTIISKLLDVKEETLTTALTCKRTKAAKGEMLVINYKLPDAIATRDAMAKCLYGALFDWIVMQVNHALLSKKDPREHKGNSIGVLDIFGFEDFAEHNNFEQFCINYANERLQYYFNQHVFKYEQEEYKREGISWRNIDFNDNTECLRLIEDKPDGLLYLLDDQCNFPCGNNETILQKFIYHHKSNPLFEVPPCRDSSFAIKHYAGKVKYKIGNFREKNLDLMRPDIVSVLKLTQMSFVRELVCSDPLALFRWHILRAFFKGYFIFSKLREFSRVKRGLSDTHLFNELSSFSVNYDRRNYELYARTTDKQQQHRSLQPTSSSSSTRSSEDNTTFAALSSEFAKLATADSCPPLSHQQHRGKTALSLQTPITGALPSMSVSPQCVHGALMRTASTNFFCPVHGSQAHLCSSEARVLSRANKILMKKYRYPTVVLINQPTVQRSNRNFKLLKQLLGPQSASSTSSASSSGKHAISIPRSTRKQTPTVTHQFQQSLQQLMDTLSHANPFFVRCIKSNAEKMPNHFDDRLVLMQLRYTGMLETVRIRQSGYSVRLTFDEFIQHYRILLPRGLVSSKMDVQVFLLSMNLKPEMYQIGKTKVFMRESEKLALDEQLHQQILKRIVTLQRWVRTWIERKSFKEMREAAIVIQTHTRRYLAQKRLSQLKMIAQYENWAANCIQKHWRSYQTRKWFTNLRHSVVRFQSACRGYLTRKKVDTITKEIAKEREEALAQAAKMNSVSISIRTTPPISHSQDGLSDTAGPIASNSSYRNSLSSISLKAIDERNTVSNSYSVPLDSDSDRASVSHSDTSLIGSSSMTPAAVAAGTIDPFQQNQSKQPQQQSTSSSSSGSTNREFRNSLECSKESSAISFPIKQLSQEDDYDLDDDDFASEVRLNRKRNIPIRKTSFKRKANKSLSDDKLLTIGDNHDLSSNSATNLADTQQQHRQLTKLSSDSNVLCASMSSFVSSGYDTNNESVSSLQKYRMHEPSIENVQNYPSNFNQQQSGFFPPSASRLQKERFDESQSSVGPIQKAKATFRNIIGKSNQETNNKRLLKQTVSAKSGIELEFHESAYSFQNKSLSNTDLGCDASSNYNYLYNANSSSSQHDIQSHLVKMPTTTQANVQSTKSLCPSQDGNFSLLSKHSTKHETGFKSGEICAICENPMLIASNPSQSHFKCTECKQLFHRKCIHLCSDIPCIKEGLKINHPPPSVLSALNPPRPPRNKQKNLKNFKKSHLAKENKDSSATLISHNLLNDSTSMQSEPQNPAATTDPKSVRITQFTDPHDILITDLSELMIMDKFITKKMREMDEVKKKTKESMVDVVFKRALKEFKANLISTYSVGYFRLTYKDLIVHFEQILLNVCQKENTYKSFPVIIGVNAFRGYMDELRKMHVKNEDKMNGYNSKKSYKRKQNKKFRNRHKKEEEVFTSYDHVFNLSTANIYTVCEVCNSLMWLMEKNWVCRCCKLTCHKKCVEKVTWTCGDNNKSSNKIVFGAPLTSLVTDDCRVPLVVEQLITKIELKGLYTEGLYRKSGASSKINELKQLFDSRITDIDLDQYSVHVLATTLKSFFRDMPEPLMTFELYDHFLWATTISDPIERVQIILNHISKLPKQNYDLLERLTFHLARVAQQETANRMNANSLAIVFAPCVLRTNKMMQLQDKLNDIGKQTICIQTIISERMKQISDTLKDIDILDTACHTASSRLSSIRHSKLNLNRENLVRTSSTVDDEEALLTRRINELITEKNHLTNILPTFQISSACSDEDMLCATENDENITTVNASSDECLSAMSTNPTPYQSESITSNATLSNQSPNEQGGGGGNFRQPNKTLVNIHHK